MSIRGRNREAYHIQTNNPTEEILRKNRVQGWLETCGPSASANCLDAIGRLPKIPVPGGDVFLQQEEVISDFLNDPQYRALLLAARPGLDPGSIPGGRVPQYYPVALEHLFGYRGAKYVEGQTWDMVKALLKAGGAAQLCLVSPGHYIAAVDLERDGFLINDSWPGRWPDGNGFNRYFAPSEWAGVKNFSIFYT